MKNMKKLLIVSSILATSIIVNSAYAAEGPKWDNLSVSYVTVDIDDADELDLAGFSFAGTKLLNENVFIGAGIAVVSDEYQGVDIDFTTVDIGIGYRYGINATTDLYGAISYESVEFEVSYDGDSESEDDNGYGLQLGLRSMLTPQFEVSAGITYVNIGDEGETGFGGSAFYYFNDQFSAGLGLSTADDVTSTSLSLRYSF